VIQVDLEIVLSNISFGFKGWQESMPFPLLLKTQGTSSIPIVQITGVVSHSFSSYNIFKIEDFVISSRIRIQ
jgi:hypothetical protein